jgi:hypothetical protein
MNCVALANGTRVCWFAGKNCPIFLQGLVFNAPYLWDKTTTVQISIKSSTYTGAKFIFKQQYSSDMAFERQAKLYIVEKLLKIIKRIKNSVRFILDNFRIVVYPFSGHIPMDSSHYSLHFDSILSPKIKISYFEGFKAKF